MYKQATVVAALILMLAAFTTVSYGAVEVVGDKCVLVDGKPFFPIGVYQCGCDGFYDVDFSMLAEAGFNTVHVYGWEGNAIYKYGQGWLDAAHQNGLMALVGLYRPDVKQMSFAGAITRIEKYRDHPALLAWHTMDEPGWDQVPTSCLGVEIDGRMGKEYMPATYHMIRQHDPDHPVTAVVCHFIDPERFMDSVDIMQADYYCVPPIPQSWYSGTGFRGIKMFVDRSRAASGGTKPFWFVCQAFNWGVQKASWCDVPPEWQRFPTFRELRTMTYTAIASGARGILYYSLGALMADNNNPGDDDHSGREMHLEWLMTVTRELRQLQPVLTADTAELIQDSNHVVAMVKSDGQDIYIIAANYERSSTETVIEVPGIQHATAEVMFAEGKAEVANAALACSFEPIESRVYRIRMDESVVTYPTK